MSVSLHQDNAKLRSYQPYCVTEASSRPQSPDLLINARDRALLEVNVNTISSLATTITTPGVHHGREVVETGSNTDIRSSATNGKLMVSVEESGSSHHIARAVSPRGSPLRASANKTLYKGTLSPQMQQTGSYNLPACRLLQCNSLRQSSCLSARLPLLFTAIDAPAKDSEQSEKMIVSDDITSPLIAVEPRGARSCAVYAEGDEVSSIQAHSIGPHTQRMPMCQFYDVANPRIRKDGSVRVNKTLSPPLDVTPISATQKSKDPNWSLHTTSLSHYHAQCPPLKVNHTSYELHADTGDRWTYQRTESKHERLRCHSSLWPSFDLNIPPQPPPHRSLNRDTTSHYSKTLERPLQQSHHSEIEPRPPPPLSRWSLHRRQATKDIKPLPAFPTPKQMDQCIHESSCPPPIPPHRSVMHRFHVDHAGPPASNGLFHSSQNPQSGPRPPPWVSMDTLNVARRQRSDARKRADAALLRDTKSSASSLYQKSLLGDGSATNHIRREIEEYKGLVLQVYPDMDLDGAAVDRWRTCWCVVM